MGRRRTRSAGSFWARKADGSSVEVNVQVVEEDVSTLASTSTQWVELSRRYDCAQGPVNPGEGRTLTLARDGSVLTLE